MDTKRKLFKPDFIQIPMQLIDDKELEQIDRLLYGIIYIYEHMQYGTCIAGNKSLADTLNTTVRVIQNSLNNLERRGYIERDYKDISKRNRIRIRSKIALKYVPPIGDRQPTSDPQVIDVPPIGDRHERPIGDHSNNNIVIRTNDNNVAAQESAAGISGKELNEVMERFMSVNPNIGRLYANKSQRAALERLIKQYGREKIEGAINILPQSNSLPFAPTITTPIQLEYRLADLVAFWKKERSRNQSMRKNIVV